MRERKRKLMRIKRNNMALVLVFTIAILGAVCFARVGLETGIREQEGDSCLLSERKKEFGRGTKGH